MGRTVRLAALISMISLLAAAGVGATPVPIVLVVVDTLRSDHLGCYGYFRDTSPRLDAFAREAVVFDRASTPVGVTLPAHVSLFSSTNPPRHGVRGNFDHFHVPVPSSDNFHLLAEILTRLGYRTAGFVSSTAVGRDTGVAAGFAVYDEASERQGGRPADATTDEVLTWLDGVDATQPLFLFVHYADPHSPYAAPAPFGSMFSTDDGLRAFLERDAIGPSPAYFEANNGYDGEVRFVDTHIGRLFDKLREKGIYDRAAIVVTADHGEGLGQHRWLYHSRVYGEQMRVPLLLRLPGRDDLRGKRRDDLVSLIDVVPTLGANLGLAFTAEERAQFEGIDVLGGKAREYVIAERVSRMPQDPERDDYYVLEDRQWKLFLREGKRYQLFDLAHDPNEIHNLAATQVEVVHRMGALLDAQLRAYASGERLTHEKIDIPESTREQLRQLGYGSGPGDRGPGSADGGQRTETLQNGEVFDPPTLPETVSAEPQAH